MDWRDDLAANLPSRNPDEPTSLRQDILDELADHLTSAAQRIALRAELEHNDNPPDEREIAARVLERFGDPRRIARRLWFDAMKGKLMMQKLTTTFAAVAACAAIAGCVLIWSALESTRTALTIAIEESRADRLAAEKANREDRRAAEKASRDMLALLAKRDAESRKPPRSPEWNPLRMKLLLGEDGQRPAVGFGVTLDGQPYQDKKQSVYKKTNAEGVVDFGLVRPGEYGIRLRTPWPELTSHRFSAHFNVNVEPGSEKELTFRVPDKKVVTADITLQLDLPEDLRKRGVTTVIQFHRPVQNPVQKLNGETRLFVCDYPGEFVHLLDDKTQRSFFESITDDFGGPYSTDRFQGKLSLPQYETISPPERRSGTWLTGENSIAMIALLLPTNEEATRSTHYTYDAYHVIDLASFVERKSNRGFVVEKPVTFTPQAGKKNIWKITLPPEMIENARARLKKFDKK